MSDPHAFDAPYEDSPRFEMDLSDGHIASGVVVMAATLPVPGEGVMPCLVYRFANPDGSGFYPPMVLAVNAERMAEVARLTEQASAAAIRVAAK